MARCPTRLFSCTVTAFLVLLCAHSAFAESMKQKADRICSAYITTPEKFKEISAFEDCEVYDSFQKSTEKAKCFSHNVEGSSSPVKFAYGTFGGGSCNPPGVYKVSAIKPFDVAGLPARNSAINGYGFGRTDKPIEYDGILLLTDNYNGDLRLVTEDDTIVLCGLVDELLGWETEAATTSPVCEKFAKQEYTILDESNGKTLEDLRKRNSLYAGKLPPETHVSKWATADLMREGTPRKILTLEYSSGSRCGCGIETLTLENSSMNPQLNEALTRLTSQDCHTGHNWNVVEIDGDGYIARDIKILKHEGIGLSKRGFHDQALYKHEYGVFKELCSIKPRAQRRIEHEIGYPDYTPID